uniref:Uncharacterized protein n=1 Tax=Hyaloperonospora arabidopsidis (strain Emoy2) TaxID=559515 RepID=M4C406_HYAAE
MVRRPGEQVRRLVRDDHFVDKTKGIRWINDEVLWGRKIHSFHDRNIEINDVTRASFMSVD